MRKLSITSALLARAPVVALALFAAACGAGSASPDDAGQVVVDEGDTAQDPSDAAQADTGATESDDGVEPVALQPSIVFAIDQPFDVGSVAVSPEGTHVAVSTQDSLGTPVSIGLYDVATGQRLELIEVDVNGLGALHWMADNRLVAAEAAFDGRWLSWDGSTLAELPSVPLDLTCADGRVDKNSGAVYSSDGLTSMSDTLCRVDTIDGSAIRTADGVLENAESFWVRPSTGEVVVLHSPNPEVSLELMTLDGTNLSKTDAVVVEFTSSVREVGVAAWITDHDTDTSTLEPGAIAVPSIDPRHVSGAGTIFISANGSDDSVFISAIDGSVIGSIPASMNLAFSDWSLDDSVFARPTLEKQIEVYNF